MAEDEAATIRTLTDYREEIALLVRQHRGSVVDSPGDNVLAEFPTATDAVSCAVEVQQILKVRNAPLPTDRKMEFRIGVHLGEVWVEGGRIYGDGVNIAARLEGLAEAGGICISGTVHEQVRRKLGLTYRSLGQQEVKNIPDRVGVFQVGIDGTPAPQVKIPPPVRALAAGAALLVVLAFVGGWWLFSRGLRSGVMPGTIRSLAVLPFVNMSGDPEQEYFADGMSEELINALTKLPGLRVAARTSAFAFKGKNEDIRVIGRRLNVGAVVEGSVRKSGDRLRVTAQLVRVADGFHIWSESYDRQMDDVFAIQDEIAHATVAALKVRLTSTAPLVKRPTTDLRAYELYLLGRHFANQRTGEGVRKAIRYFEESLQADPNYALAHVGLADSYMLLWYYRHESREEALPRAEAAVTRALALDESSGEAHVSLANFRVQEWKWDEAEREFHRGLQLSPGYSTAHHWYSWFLYIVGRTEEGLVEIQKALELDPLSPIINRTMGDDYLGIGDYATAIEPLQKTLELNPDDPLARSGLTVAYLEQGMEPEIFECFPGQGSRPEIQTELRNAYRAGGVEEYYRKGLELRIEETQKDCTDLPYVAARMLARLGEADRMLACLQEEVDERRVLTILGDQVYKPYRSDPRFVAILKQMGLEGSSQR
jgi:TolB-like protein/Tfp pilus assembly protein PilF